MCETNVILGVAKMAAHPLTKLFPPMTPDNYAELKASILMQGQLVPAVTYQGQLLDGVHRARACEELGIELKTVEWNGQGSLVAHIVALNRHRRHLTPDQLAAV